MLDRVKAAIDESPLADAVKRDMRKCLPWIAELMGDIVPADPLVVVAATDKGGVAFSSETFPLLDPNVAYDGAAMATAIHTAIESGTGNTVIWNGIAYLLGENGIEAATRDFQEIAACGGHPVFVLMTTTAPGTVSVIVTVCPWEKPKRVLH